MNKSVRTLEAINLSKKSPLRLLVWRVRRSLRDLTGNDVLQAETKGTARTKVRNAYLRVDGFISKHLPDLVQDTPREVACKQVREILELELGYRFFEVNETKPWGAYYRIVDEQADRFLLEFFPGLSPQEAKLGREDVILSPKILLVYPAQRLSLQYHARRAERWRFLTTGGYYKSQTDDPGQLVNAKAGDVVQFATGERHRLCGTADGYAVVAEIWQHTDSAKYSDEDDIVRLQDDYKR